MGDFDFLEDLGKKLQEAANDLTKFTEDALEIQKKRSDIRALNRGNDRDLIDLGKAVYEKFTKGELEDPDMVALCEAIAKREMQVKDLEEDITRIKGEE